MIGTDMPLMVIMGKRSACRKSRRNIVAESRRA